MSNLAGKCPSVLLLVAFMMGTPGGALADNPAALVLPRVKPLSERTMGIQPWATMSESPFGGQRRGGSDQRGFAFSPDGKLLATEDAGGWQLEVWDVTTGKSLGRFGRIQDPVALDFSPDGKSLVTAGGSRYCPIELWDLAVKKRRRSLDEGVNVTQFISVSFSADGKTLALAGHSPAVHLHDAASGDEIGLIEGLGPVPKYPGSESIDALAWSPDGRTLALVRNDQVLLVEVANGKKRCLVCNLPIPFRDSRNWEFRPHCQAFSPSGRILALGCPDGLIRLWDVVAGAELLPLAGHPGGTRALRFMADGTVLLSYGWDNRVRTWPVAQARTPWPRPDALSPSDRVRFWDDLKSDNPLKRYEAIRVLAGSPDQALPLVREHVKPVPKVDSERIKQLVASLSSGSFNERKKAAGELRKLGDLALPALQRAEEEMGHDQMLGRFREELASRYPTPEQVQSLRALEILEQIGSDKARQMLEEMSKGAVESHLTRQSKARLERLRHEPARLAAQAKLDQLWRSLADEDCQQAFQAMRALAARPEKSLPLLRDRLGPVLASTVLDDGPERIARLIADLDSNRFTTREEASQELAKLGRRAEKQLNKALQGSPSAEAKRRLEALLQDLAKPKLWPERLQAERALEVLEWIGTHEARQVLRDLAREAKAGWFKSASAEALQRLKP